MAIMPIMRFRFGSLEAGIRHKGIYMERDIPIYIETMKGKYS